MVAISRTIQVVPAMGIPNVTLHKIVFGICPLEDAEELVNLGIPIPNSIKLPFLRPLESMGNHAVLRNFIISHGTPISERWFFYFNLLFPIVLLRPTTKVIIVGIF